MIENSTTTALSINNQQSSINNDVPRSLLWPYDKQVLPVFDRLAIDRQALHDLASNIALNLIQQLHRLDNAEDLPNFNRVAGLHKRRSARRRSLIERPNDRRLHHVKPHFGDRGNWRGGRRYYGCRTEFRRRRWCRRHRIKPRLAAGVHNRLLAGPLDPNLDIAALHLKLGDVLLF